jgi:hypothetical protein
MGLPRTPGLESPTKSEFIGDGTISPSKNQSFSRKLRNATPRQHDIEFAADIGQGLLEEVRKLQALLAQRDQKLNEATSSITRSNRQIELLERKVKQMHEDQGSFQIVHVVNAQNLLRKRIGICIYGTRTFKVS